MNKSTGSLHILQFSMETIRETIKIKKLYLNNNQIEFLVNGTHSRSIFEPIPIRFKQNIHFKSASKFG